MKNDRLNCPKTHLKTRAALLNDVFRNKPVRLAADCLSALQKEADIEQARTQMNIEDEVVKLAAEAHSQTWSQCEPSDDKVSRQTKKAQATCKYWQKTVKQKFGNRFAVEHGINGKKGGRSQKIDLVDLEDRAAYELKSSPNNVHMEIYRDVFKALVFNERNPAERIKTLVFIAPRSGIQKLGPDFPKDVQAICGRIGLDLKLREIP